MRHLLNQITCGDSRTLADEIKPESVDMIFTDPVYKNIEDYRWLAEVACRVLKPSGMALVFTGVAEIYDCLKAMVEGGLVYRWQIPLYKANQQNFMYSPVGRNKYTPCFWMDRNHTSKPIHPAVDIRKVTYPDSMKSGFEWAKSPSYIAHYLRAFTNEGDLVFDPFSGLGTLPAIAKKFQRNFIAFEINPERASQAMERVLSTTITPVLLEGGLTLPAPDGGDSAPSQTLSTPDMFSAIEHEPTPAPLAGKAYR